MWENGVKRSDKTRVRVSSPVCVYMITNSQQKKKQLVQSPVEYYNRSTIHWTLELESLEIRDFFWERADDDRFVSFWKYVVNCMGKQKRWASCKIFVLLYFFSDVILKIYVSDLLGILTLILLQVFIWVEHCNSFRLIVGVKYLIVEICGKHEYDIVCHCSFLHTHDTALFFRCFILQPGN